MVLQTSRSLHLSPNAGRFKVFFFFNQQESPSGECSSQLERSGKVTPDHSHREQLSGHSSDDAADHEDDFEDDDDINVSEDEIDVVDEKTHSLT